MLVFSCLVFGCGVWVGVEVGVRCVGDVVGVYAPSVPGVADRIVGQAAVGESRLGEEGQACQEEEGHVRVLRGKARRGLGVGLLGEGRCYLVSAGGAWSAVRAVNRALYARAYLGSWWYCVVGESVGE